MQLRSGKHKILGNMAAGEGEEEAAGAERFRKPSVNTFFSPLPQPQSVATEALAEGVCSSCGRSLSL